MLTSFYLEYMKDNPELFVVADDEERGIVGFCMGYYMDKDDQMQNFLRRVKRYRKRNNLPELKYVAVTEEGKNTKRFHHHIVMSGGIDINTLAEIWGKGYTTAKPLKFDDSGITGIAKYLVKDPILGKRWCGSKNLERPKETQRDGRLSQRKVRQFHDSGVDNRDEIENIYQGYSLVDVNPMFNEVNNGYYLSIRMKKKPEKPKKNKRGIQHGSKRSSL